LGRTLGATIPDGGLNLSLSSGRGAHVAYDQFRIIDAPKPTHELNPARRGIRIP
jgi:hypothetical protein